MTIKDERCMTQNSSENKKLRLSLRAFQLLFKIFVHGSKTVFFIVFVLSLYQPQILPAGEVTTNLNE